MARHTGREAPVAIPKLCRAQARVLRASGLGLRHRVRVQGVGLRLGLGDKAFLGPQGLAAQLSPLTAGRGVLQHKPQAVQL